MRFKKNEENIRDYIENSIRRCMCAADSMIRENVSAQEPDYIEQLFQGISEGIYKGLSVFATDYQFAISGIYCHQKPLADIGMENNPKIGDLLLVYIEENKYKKKKCNALLMQAKIIQKAPDYIREEEEHQLKLYEEWPIFKLQRANGYNGIEINIQPKTLNQGAQYLLIQAPYEDEKLVCCAYPDKKLVPEKRLSEQIIDLMKFFTGRPFQLDTDENSEGWSKLIMDIIDINEESKLNRSSGNREKEDQRIIFGDKSLISELNVPIVMSNIEDSSYSIVTIPYLMICVRENKREYCQEKLPFD